MQIKITDDGEYYWAPSEGFVPPKGRFIAEVHRTGSSDDDGVELFYIRTNNKEVAHQIARQVISYYYGKGYSLGKVFEEEK